MLKKKQNSKLKIIPLGGLEQIGMNITAFEYEDTFVQKDSISKSSLANKNAWESLYNKYKKDIQKNPTTYAKYLFRLGNEVVLFNQKVAMEYYRNSFYIKKSKEALVFFVLSSLRMKSTISKLLDYQKNHLFR